VVSFTPRQQEDLLSGKLKKLSEQDEPDPWALEYETAVLAVISRRANTGEEGQQYAHCSVNVTTRESQ
jgi:hypothetical protein